MVLNLSHYLQKVQLLNVKFVVSGFKTTRWPSFLKSEWIKKKKKKKIKICLYIFEKKDEFSTEHEFGTLYLDISFVSKQKYCIYIANKVYSEYDWIISKFACTFLEKKMNLVLNMNLVHYFTTLILVQNRCISMFCLEVHWWTLLWKIPLTAWSFTQTRLPTIQSFLSET